MNEAGCTKRFEDSGFDLKYKNLSIYHEAGKCHSLSNNVRVVSPGGDGLLSLSGHC